MKGRRARNCLGNTEEESTPDGYIALVERREQPTPWQSGLQELIHSYAVVKPSPSLGEVSDSLEQAHLFAKVGEKVTLPTTTKQSLIDYIASFHSRTRFSLTRMIPQEAAAFDQRLHALVEPWSHENILELKTTSTIIWGKPLR